MAPTFSSKHLNVAALLVFAMATFAGAEAQVANEGRASRWSNVPGTVIAHSPRSSGVYVGSPGLVQLGEGVYLAKHDEFGPQSSEHQSAVTRVYRSTDHGRTWTAIARIAGLFWSNIFAHEGAIYQIGTHHHHGQLVVVKSTDGGVRWTTPKDGKSGLIRPGKWATGPMPMLTHNGRLWRAIESADAPGGWGEMYRPRVMSIPLKGDLLDANQWTISDPIKRDGRWLGGTFWCVLEGNVVLGPDRRIRNILRSNHDTVAAVATVSHDGRILGVDPSFNGAPFPGAAKKFTIRYDPQSRLYWTLSNLVAEKDDGPRLSARRNTLALASSPDLRAWTVRTILLHHPDVARHAFQYVDWLFDGEHDIVACARTAYEDGQGGAANAHDANFLTFHRFEDFRALTMADGVQIEPPQYDEFDVGPIRLTGRGFQLAMLSEGAKAFANRGYVWRGVPAALEGATITHGNGGFAGRIMVESPEPRIILVATGAEGIEKLDLRGYRARKDLRFSYTDQKQTSMEVFERRLKPGERLVLPQGNWTGTLAIIPRSVAGAAAPSAVP